VVDQIHKIVTTLPDLTDLRDVRKIARRRLARGNAAFVADLGIALARRYGAGADEMWQYRQIFDHLLRLLATTAGRENVAQAVRLVSATENGDRKLARYAASLLAACQPPEDLAAAFYDRPVPGGVSEELRACLVHELVLRGIDVANAPGIARWATSPHWRHHPLSRLPLTLSDVEDGGPWLVRHRLDGDGGHPLPYGQSASLPIPVPATARVPPLEETTTRAWAATAASAVASWTEESNGRVEARVFEFAEPLDTDAAPTALLGLGVECLHGIGERGFSVSVYPLRNVWRVLFAAAATGGAHDHGSFGAYGRLAAWQSLAGLAGAADGAPTDEVEARSRACSWYDFGADTPWFAHVVWDFGLAALAPDRRRLAVLAATDTD
jgi:hypothetical protein